MRIKFGQVNLSGRLLDMFEQLVECIFLFHRMHWRRSTLMFWSWVSCSIHNVDVDAVAIKIVVNIDVELLGFFFFFPSSTLA